MGFQVFTVFLLAIEMISANFVSAEKLTRSYENLYGNEENRKNLIRIIQDSSSWIDFKKASQKFKDSGIDTVENFAESKRVVSEAYQFPMSRDQIRKKVIALKFLRYSQRWSYPNECIGLLEKLTIPFDQSPEQIKRAILLDIAQLADICHRFGKKPFVSLMKRNPHSVLKNQISYFLDQKEK